MVKAAGAFFLNMGVEVVREAMSGEGKVGSEELG